MAQEPAMKWANGEPRRVWRQSLVGVVHVNLTVLIVGKGLKKANAEASLNWIFMEIGHAHAIPDNTAAGD